MTEEPGVLQSVRLQRVGPELVTEQRQQQQQQLYLYISLQHSGKNPPTM